MQVRHFYLPAHGNFTFQQPQQQQQQPPPCATCNEMFTHDDFLANVTLSRQMRNLDNETYQGGVIIDRQATIAKILRGSNPDRVFILGRRAINLSVYWSPPLCEIGDTFLLGNPPQPQRIVELRNIPALLHDIGNLDRTYAVDLYVDHHQAYSHGILTIVMDGVANGIERDWRRAIADLILLHGGNLNPPN